mmetsp:Transcript_43939/g.122506  ORF Transcript_43939/g.122506 Transcript_43939/m.122506 type:complete len:258 (-) Transcript_43939:17-790(-)
MSAVRSASVLSPAVDQGLPLETHLEDRGECYSEASREAKRLSKHLRRKQTRAQAPTEPLQPHAQTLAQRRRLQRHRLATRVRRAKAGGPPGLEPWPAEPAGLPECLGREPGAVALAVMPLKVPLPDDGSRVVVSDPCDSSDPDHSNTDEDRALEPWPVDPVGLVQCLGRELGAVALASLPLKVPLPDDGSRVTSGGGCSDYLASEPRRAGPVAPFFPRLWLEQGGAAPARGTPLRSQAALFSPLRSQAKAFVPTRLA